MTTTSYKELLAQREALEAQINEARKLEVGNAVAKIRELVADYGLTEQDVFPSSTRKSANKGLPVAPKYRDPETGATWTGRGKAPTWIRDKDRAQFQIA